MAMKRSFLISTLTLLLALLCTEHLSAQGKAIIHRGRGYWHQEWTVDNGDSIPLIHMLPIYKFNRGIDTRRYYKLIRTVKKVYPLAQIARREMADMEDELRRLPTLKEQRAYVRGIERRIKEQYTPLIKRMTRYEGKILVKLIDRETEYTAFQIIKDFRGGFVAGFWQGLARIFGNNLKLEYERDGEDKLIEQIVLYYEAGLL